jgi:hypothetical protein
MYRFASVIVATGLLCCACASTSHRDLRVRTEYSDTVNWTEMGGFRMASSSSSTASARYPKIESMVSRILIQEMAARGYERIVNGSTDFRVGFDLVFRGDTRHREGDTPYGVDSPPGSVRGSGQLSHLTIRMLDPETSQVLWQGTVTGFVIDAVNPEPELRKAIRRLLAEFPPITG